MSGLIPEDVIRAVEQATSIHELVSEYVALKRQGRNWVGHCPFHQDKDPSFTVNEEKGLFHCFGCGAGGNAFRFLMMMEGLGFQEAVRRLGERAGIRVEATAGRSKEREEEGRLLELMAWAAGFYHRALMGAPPESAVKRYLRKRGLKDETVREFQIGWAPPGWDTLLKAIRSQGLEEGLAERAGLLVRRRGGEGFYDRFRERVIFPIRDASGRVVALGGRILTGDGPKYVNSPESPIYRKKEVLYGYSEARAHIRRSGRGYVVEGYMDLLALWEAGIREAVATLGTALTGSHASLLERASKDWILVFDGDEAGLAAAERALPELYKRGMRPKVLVLPEGEDPDSFVRAQGAEAWYRLSESAPQGVDFLLDRLLSGDPGPERRAEAAERALQVIAAEKSPVRLSALVDHVAKRTGIRAEALWDRVRKRRAGPGPTPPKAKASFKRHRAEEDFLSFLFHHPERIPDFEPLSPEGWLPRELKGLWEAALHLYEMTGGLDPEELIQRLEPGERDLARRLVSSPPPFPDPETALDALLKWAESKRQKAARAELRALLASEDLDEAERENLLRRLQELYYTARPEPV